MKAANIGSGFDLTPGFLNSDWKNRDLCCKFPPKVQPGSSFDALMFYLRIRPLAPEIQQTEPCTGLYNSTVLLLSVSNLARKPGPKHVCGRSDSRPSVKLESPQSRRTDHFSNIVADREFSTGCYLFTVSNSGLLFLY